MQQDLFETGLERRKATLGAAYVEANLAAADEFTHPFQEAMTAWCWGFLLYANPPPQGVTAQEVVQADQRAVGRHHV